MEDSLLIDAVERFVNGTMPEHERIYFEDLRKNNPELDQAVVEHMFFLNELNKFGATKSFKHSLYEVENKLADEGFVFRKPLAGKAKVVQLWSKYKRIVAVAASIAGVVSLFIASLVSAVNNNKETNIKPLVDKLNETVVKTRQIQNQINQLQANTAIVEKPRVNSKFRGTGFLIDVNNNYIITNAHVASEGKNQLIIENNKGEQFAADAVYVDVVRDLAILKIKDVNFKKLAPLPYVIRKTNAGLGEQVFMLGFPKQEIVYGEGYVSAKNGYQMDTIYCQLNTAANEGSSGSPVINKKGELIGILTSSERNAQGVVYAIKSINIHRAIEEAKKIDANADLKITATASLKGLDRESQIKKLEDYVFMIKGN
ncbi:MAG TPA: serine protease [Ferruginibacter sp.]|nr:serine protease [Ferruginibacter sp.]